MAVNRFKNNLDKEKTKEIVGNSVANEEVVVENNVHNPAETENKTEDTVADDEITVANAPVEEIKEEVKEEVKTRNKAEKLKPKKTMENKVVVKTDKFGVSIREDLVEKIKVLGEDSNNKKPNDVVTDLLKSLYDVDNDEFNVSFEKKSSLKVTSFNLPKEYINAIKKINKKTGIPKSEVFNKLIEEALKDYF